MLRCSCFYLIYKGNVLLELGTLMEGIKVTMRPLSKTAVSRRLGDTLEMGSREAIVSNMGHERRDWGA